MREILFRGKTYDGKWEQGDLRHGGYVRNDSETYIMRADYALHNIPVDPETVGQYTGLNDKNGKKIFEGDIVREVGGEYFQGYHEIDRKFVVDFLDTLVNLMIGSGCDCTYEIIGNIHDNPELLGGET